MPGGYIGPTGDLACWVGRLSGFARATPDFAEEAIAAVERVYPLAGSASGAVLAAAPFAAAILAMILGRSPDGIILGGLAVLVPVVNAILRRISSNGSSGSNGTS